MRALFRHTPRELRREGGGGEEKNEQANTCTHAVHAVHAEKHLHVVCQPQNAPQKRNMI